MNSFMIDIDLPHEPDEGFMQLIPYQRAHISKLMKKGMLTNYSLSFDRRKLWVVLHAESHHQVKQILGSFPIFNYIRFTINNLLFHEANTITAPQLWLN